MKWTAREIARALHLNIFRAKHVVMVPDCMWTGHEADMLVVRNDLRLVDIEIKISRSDLKADAAKDKWFDMPDRWPFGAGQRPRTPRPHPPKIWKHYYCMPRDIWTDELLPAIQPASGILFIKDWGNETPLITLKRQARPNKTAQPITAEDVIDIARLQSNRMWDAFDEVDRHRRQRENRQTATG